MSKMFSITMLIRGALANTLAFTSSSYLFSRLSKDSIDKERRRHDLAIEQFQKAQVEWMWKIEAVTSCSTNKIGQQETGR